VRISLFGKKEIKIYWDFKKAMHLLMAVRFFLFGEKEIREIEIT